jgi:hypothetical protein
MRGHASVYALSLGVFGSLLYLKSASAAWRSPAEGGEVPITGEPFVWAAALPILVLVILLNFAWGVWILLRRPAKGNTAFAASLLVMVGSVMVDFAHH